MAWACKKLSRNVHEITIDLTRNRDWEQWVLLRSDVHHDNPKCKQDMERRHLDEAIEYDAPIIDNGDLFCAMHGSGFLPPLRIALCGTRQGQSRNGRNQGP